jgi:hypothetical protein
VMTARIAAADEHPVSTVTSFHGWARNRRSQRNGRLILSAGPQAGSTHVV